MSEDSLASDLIHASRVSRQITPGLALGAASTDNPLQTSQAFAAFSQSVLLRNQIAQLDPKHQASMWTTLSQSQQIALSKVGYKPPQDSYEGRAWWQSVLDVSKDVLATAVAGAQGAAGGLLLGAATGSLPGAVAGAVAGAGVGVVRGAQKSFGQDESFWTTMNWVSDDALHAYRTMKYFETDKGTPLSQWDINDWANAWRKTDDDEADYVIEPTEALKRHGISMPEQTRDILISAAEMAGQRPEFVQSTLEAKYGPQAVYDAQNHPEWQRAVAAIGAYGMSPGRALARQLGLAGQVGNKFSLIHVPGTNINIGPKVSTFDLVSGGMDGLVRWYGDPLNVAFPAGGTLRILGGAEAGVGRFRAYRDIAKYSLAHGAEDVRLLNQQSGVQRAFQRIAGHYESGRGIAGVVQDYDYLAPLADEFDGWMRAKGGTAEAAGLYFEGKAAQVNLMSGRMAGFADVEPLLPRLGLAGGAKKDAVEGILRGVEKAESVPGLRKGAIGIRRFVNLVPTKETINPLERPGEALEFMRAAGMYSLPREMVDGFVNAFAAGDIGGKRAAFVGMLEEIGRRLGAPRHPEMQKYFDRIIGVAKGEFDLGEFNRIYGRDVTGSGISAIEYNGRKLQAAVAEHQLTTEWALPNFREIVKARRETAAWRVLTEQAAQGLGFNLHIPSGLVDQLMDQVWKPLVLLRAAFPLRASGEEAARSILENGLVPHVRARFAASAVKEMDKQVTRGFLKPLSPVETTVRQIIADTTLETMSKIKTGAYASLGGERYMRAAHVLAGHYGASLLPRSVSAVRDVAGVTDRPDVIFKRMANGYGKRMTVKITQGRGYKRFARGGEHFVPTWQMDLGRHLNDESFRIWLQHLEDGPRAETEILAYLKSDKAKGIRKLSPRADHEGLGLASQDEALADWAATMRQSYEGLVFNEAGQFDPKLVATLRSGNRPALGDLSAAPENLRPLSVSGKEMIAVPGKFWWEQAVHKGFDWVGDSINWMTRQPLFVHEFAKALDEVAPLAKGLPSGSKLTTEWAIERALDRVIPNIDRAEVRSQFSTQFKNLLPFWHAQEQFIKRWAKAIGRNPGILRRLQLTMQGFRHSGMVHTNENGEDYFYYPGAMFTQAALAKVGKLIFGADTTVPIPVDLTGKVRFIAPGIESPKGAFLPSPGPLLSIPLSAMRIHYPEFTAQAEKTVLDERGVGKPVWEQLVPSTVVRLYKLFGAREDSDEQMASAMAQAVQYLEASGQGLRDGATVEEQQDFQDRARNFARVLAGMRLIYGFSVPASPQVEFAKNLNPEFTKLINQLGIEDATTEFLRRNPGADAYTVFRSEAAARGARFDPNASAGEWIRDNGDFVRKYGASTAWFIPQAPGGFDQNTWRDSFAYGLKRHKAPDELWRDIKYSNAAQVYYPSLRAYQQAVAGVTGPARDEVEDSWFQWKQQFLNLHPVFAAELVAGSTRDAERQVQLSAVETMLADPARPKVPQEESLRSVILSWRNVQSALRGLRHENSEFARAQKDALRQSFTTWASTLTDPVASMFYNALIAPQLD